MVRAFGSKWSDPRFRPMVGTSSSEIFQPLLPQNKHHAYEVQDCGQVFAKIMKYNKKECTGIVDLLWALKLDQ